ncbi:MAG: hypothetical protein ACE5GU_13025 [Candidatus Scalinduaceae bacterium]
MDVKKGGRSSLWWEYRRSRSPSQTLLKWGIYFAMAMYGFGILGVLLIFSSFAMTTRLPFIGSGLLALSLAWTCIRIWRAFDVAHIALYAFEEKEILQATRQNCDKISSGRIKEISKQALESYLYASSFGGTRHAQGMLLFHLYFMPPFLGIGFMFSLERVRAYFSSHIFSQEEWLIWGMACFAVLGWRWMLSWATARAKKESIREDDPTPIYFRSQLHGSAKR